MLVLLYLTSASDAFEKPLVEQVLLEWRQEVENSQFITSMYHTEFTAEYGCKHKHFSAEVTVPSGIFFV